MKCFGRILGIGFILSLLLTAGAFAAPPITWEPGELQVEIGSGIADPVNVSFHSDRALEGLTVEVVPELAPFIAVDEPSIATVEKGSTHAVQLSLYLPPETPEGIYEGTLHLREGHRTVARPLPIVVTVDYGDAVIASGTRVLTRKTASHLIEVSPDGRVLTFDGDGADLAGLAPADILVVPATELLPAGFLGRIVSISSDEGRVAIVTEAAALTDAVLSADLDVQFDLGAESVVEGRAIRGSKLASKGLFEPLEVSLEAVLWDQDQDPATTDDQVRAKGNVTLTPNATLSLAIDDGEVQEFSIGADATAETRLTVEAELHATFERELEVARFRFRPIVFWIGWLPVYLQPEVAFTVNVNAEASGALTVGAGSTATVEAKVLYDGSGWSTQQDATLDFFPIGPTLDASAQIEGRAGPTLSVLLYGVVGPELDLYGYERLSAELGRCPYWWDLTAGVSLDAEVDMGPFSDLVTGPSYPGLINQEILLAHADECTDDGGGNGDGGGDDGGGAEERIFFSSDRSGDPDIWSIAPDGTDLRLVVDKPDRLHHPMLSPDGTKLAYLDSNLLKIFVRDLATGEEIVLDGSRLGGNFEWAADGSAILGSWSSCSNDIRRYPLTGGQTVILDEPSRDTLWGVDWNTGKIFYTNDPCWSPSIQIKVYDPNTGAKTVLQGNDGRAESQGNVSLDGQWLVYDKPDFSYTGPKKIYLISTSGGPETRISSGPEDRFAHFSPDGGQVVFSRKIGGKWSLWVVNRDGSNERPLLDDEFNNLTPDWAIERSGSGGSPGNWYEDYDFAASGVIGYWPFDGDALDRSGNHNDGVWTADDYVAGRFGEAHSLAPGVFMTVPMPPELSSFDQVTLSAWYRSETEPNDNENLLGLGRDGQGAGLDHAYLFLLGSRNPGATFSAWGADAAIGTSQHYLSHQPYDGSWHLLTATWDGSVSRLYVDGALVAENPDAGGVITPKSGEPLYINRHNWWATAWSSRLSGEVDEVVIFDHALSPSEVALLATDADEDGVVDFWQVP